MTAGVEPTDSDCDWPSDEEDEEAQKLAVSINSCFYLNPAYN